MDGVRWNSFAPLHLAHNFYKENLWASGVRQRRETELRWRVKENFIAVLISFIWYDSFYIPREYRIIKDGTPLGSGSHRLWRYFRSCFTRLCKAIASR